MLKDLGDLKNKSLAFYIQIPFWNSTSGLKRNYFPGYLPTLRSAQWFTLQNQHTDFVEIRVYLACSIQSSQSLWLGDTVVTACPVGVNQGSS